MCDVFLAVFIHQYICIISCTCHTICVCVYCSVIESRSAVCLHTRTHRHYAVAATVKPCSVCMRVMYNFNNCCRCRWCSLSFLYVAYAAVAPIFIYKRNKRVWYSFSFLFQKKKNFYNLKLWRTLFCISLVHVPVSMFSCFSRNLFWIRCSLFSLWTKIRAKKSLGIEYTGVFRLIYRVFFTLQHMKCFWNCLLLYSLFRTFSIILFLSLSFSLSGVTMFYFVHTFTTRSKMKLGVHISD